MKKSFEQLVNTFIETNRTYDYYVNWNKVNKNLKNVEVQLNILNVLIGKDNLKEEFKSLLAAYPEVINAIPLLLAIRDKEIKICDISSNGITVEELSFDKYVPEMYEEYFKFFKLTGLLEIFENKKIKNLVDYVFGVEVGLDSNGRKNRSGTIMELIVEKYIKELQNEMNFSYMAQANAATIFKEYGVKVNVDKASRRFDFAIYFEEKLFLVEVNFYSGGGSKLKSTAGEFIGLNNTLNEQDFRFIWVTDGFGWKTSLNPLEEAFNSIDYIFNISDLEEGKLKKVLKNEL